MVATATTTEKWPLSLEKAWVRLVRTPAAVVDGVQAALKADGFPPLEWYDVLLEVGREADGRLRQKDLGARLLIARYNLTRLLDRLEAEGFVRREACEDDARGADVVITQAGEALRRRMWPTYRAAVQERLGGRLTADQLNQLAGLLAKLA